MDGLRLSGLPTSNDPAQILAHCPASSCCLPITVLPIPGEAQLSNTYNAAARIYVAQQGHGRRWYQRSGRTIPLHTAPRMIEIYEKGLNFDHCRWEGQAGRTVLVELADADVQAMTDGELHTLPLRTHHELFDDRVSRILLELADEALRGLPNGRLYAQGLSLALIGVLASSYVTGSESTPSSEAGRFGPLQQRQLVHLIHHGLACDLSLTRLAAEVGLSPYHFVRVFKATFGTTPHRYVQERRLEAAAEALQRQSRRSIADIALEHGFASQAHMTDLMRRRFGVTPRMLRRRG
jgi:AraC family transcriptional regulator